MDNKLFSNNNIKRSLFLKIMEKDDTNKMMIIFL
jgi:hypothetical protein